MLTKYDKNWKVVKENDKPFVGYKKQVNHIGDIDVYNHELGMPKGFYPGYKEEISEVYTYKID